MSAGGASSEACPVCAGPVGNRPVYRLGRWSVHGCASCGHGVTRPVPTPEELQAIYDSEAYYDDRGMYRATLVAADHARARYLREHFGGASLLDVGAGVGALMAAAAEEGYEVTGTEISVAARRAARAHHGQEIRSGGFSLEQFAPGERFDVVTMFHVLEHMAAPLAALELARELLHPGGHLFIEVPNREAFGARFPGRTRRDVFDLPLHFHHFTLRSLTFALRRVGLEVESVRPSVPHVLDTLLGAASRGVRGVRGA